MIIDSTQFHTTPFRDKIYALFSFSFLILLLFSFSPETRAINASPFPYEAEQDDGSIIKLHIRGDERYHWQEDTEGYTVLRSNGTYFYAVRNPAGKLVPGKHKVGQANPRALGLQKHLLPSASVLAELKAKAPVFRGPSHAHGGEESSVTHMQQNALSGTVRNLVVMIRFSDHASRQLPGVADFEVLFNAQQPHPDLAPTGSLRSLYLENSYGQLTLDSDVRDWITVSNSEAYYADGQSGSHVLWEALKEALNVLDQTIDFRDYDQDNNGYIDSITFIHSGYGAEWGGVGNENRIWSHRWAIQPAWISDTGVRVFDYHISPGLWGTSGSEIGRVGVIAHETGHFFGLPDLYDTNGGGDGIGSWGLMANSWGFDGSQHYPPHLSAWSKIDLGWMTPTLLTDTGDYQLAPAEQSPDVFKITQGYPTDEYLLIENRQPLGFDGAIPRGGLTIWHIDDAHPSFNDEGYPGQALWPQNGNHYRVALLQADGDYALEKGLNRGDSGDAYHPLTASEINDNTVPGTQTYQDGIVADTKVRIHSIASANPVDHSVAFSFEDLTIPPEPPSAPAGLTAQADGAEVTLSWTDSVGEDVYYILRNGSQVGSAVADTTEYIDSNVPEGSHTYLVRASNGGGEADSSLVNVEVVLPAIAYPVSQSTSQGTVVGALTELQSPSGMQTLTERESGGRPSNRRSQLEHVWRIDGIDSASASQMLTIDAEVQAGSTDGFEFSYSYDGVNYPQSQTLAPVLAGESSLVTVQLQTNPSSVWVKVTDTNRDRGERTLDTVYVRQIYVEWSDETLAPTAPQNLLATDLGPTSADLTWTPGISSLGYQVLQGMVLDSAVDVTAGDIGPSQNSHTVPGLEPLSSYRFWVCNLDISLRADGCSNGLDVNTPDVAAEALTLNITRTWKEKGNHRVELSWDYTGAVVLTRDGTELNLSGGQSHIDYINRKGGATYTYVLCTTETTPVCSEEQVAQF